MNMQKYVGNRVMITNGRCYGYTGQLVSINHNQELAFVKLDNSKLELPFQFNQLAIMINRKGELQ